MEVFEYDGLILEVYTEGNSIKNIWKGKSRHTHPAQFLKEVFDKIIDRSRGKKLSIDFSELIIMNSSTIRFLIDGIMKLSKESIPTKIVYDNSSPWQEGCFKPITIMTQNLPGITITAINSSE